MRIIRGNDVRDLLDFSSCIAEMEEALRALTRGEVVQPLRTAVAPAKGEAIMGLMPAAEARSGLLGIKVLTIVPSNRERLRPSHQGFVALFDPRDGAARALVDASALTEIRTAAVSAVATRRLAREEAKTLSVLGSGAQGESHARAIPAVRPIERVVIWDRRPERARALADRIGDGAEVAPSVDSAVRVADVLCTTTATRIPIVEREWVRPGTHINAIGAAAPGSRELPSELVRSCRVYVDSRRSAWAEADDLRVPRSEGKIGTEHVVGELGELLVGAAPGRASPEDITLFKSVGIAVEDLYAARKVLERAMALDRGIEVDLEPGPTVPARR